MKKLITFAQENQNPSCYGCVYPQSMLNNRFSLATDLTSRLDSRQFMAPSAAAIYSNICLVENQRSPDHFHSQMLFFFFSYRPFSPCSSSSTCIASVGSDNSARHFGLIAVPRIAYSDGAIYNNHEFEWSVSRWELTHTSAPAQTITATTPSIVNLSLATSWTNCSENCHGGLCCRVEILQMHL